MKQKNEYIGTDIPLCAFLIVSCQANLTQASRQGKRITFYLDAEKDMDKASMDYFTGKDKVSATQYVRAMDLLKDAIRRVNSRADDPEPIQTILPRVLNKVGNNQ